MTQQYGFVGLNRRSLLKLGTASLISTAMSGLWANQPAQAATSTIDPDEVLKSLLDGNQRFIEHHASHPHQSAQRLTSLASGQNPIATILSCADSRVPAEILFDVGLGDVFNVRVAGNVVNPEVIGSLEYAVALLHTPLLIVLGHERCGAVTAAVQHQSVPGSIGTFVQDIAPAIELAQISDRDSSEVAIDKTVIANVHYQMDLLMQRSALIAEQQKAGTLKVIGARYDLDSGAVRLV